MGIKFSSIVSVITGNRNEIVVSAGQQQPGQSVAEPASRRTTTEASSPSIPTRSIQTRTVAVAVVAEQESTNQQEQATATTTTTSTILAETSAAAIIANQASAVTVDNTLAVVAQPPPPSVAVTHVAPNEEQVATMESMRGQPLEQTSQAVAYGKPFMIRVDLPRSPSKSTPSRVRRLSKMLFSNLGSPKGTNATTTTTLDSNNNNNQIAAFSGEDDPSKKMPSDPMRSTRAFFRRFSSPNMLWGRPGSTSTGSSPANSPNVNNQRGLIESSGGVNPQQLVESAAQGLDPQLLPTPLHSGARRGSTASTSLKYQGTSGGSSTLSSSLTPLSTNVNIRSGAVIADPSLASLEENEGNATASQPDGEGENVEHVSLIRALGGIDEVTASSSSQTTTPFSSHHSNTNATTAESSVQGQEIPQINQESTTTSGGLQREASSTRTSSTNDGAVACAQANPVRSSSHSSGSNPLLRMLPRKLSKFGKSSMMSGGSNGGGAHSAFWCADEATRECHLGDFCQTSLLTFHAQNADAVNVKGMDGPLVQVPTQATVTIYANVGSGRYLSISQDVTGPVLRFDTAPRQIREDPSVAIRCEFVVRRAYPGTHRDSGDTSDSTGPLYFGDSVTLESRYMPGSFLCIQSNKLSLTSPCAAASMADDTLVTPKLFILHSPTLRELVQINAQAAASPPPSSTFISPSGQILDGVIQGNDFEREEARIEAEKQRQWMEAMAAHLPVDLAQRVFEYHRDWIRIARLTCKSWKAQAEKRIRRIRVNGEFCSLETDEEKFNLVDFVRRCANLEVLTLRNVISLTDEDIARIVENTNLSSLVLGGCRRLSDRSTRYIATKLTRLRHLNMALTDITDESIRIVAEEAGRLRELNLYNCPRVTVDGINGIDPKGFIHLEHINLRGTVAESHLVQDFRRKKPSVVVLTGPASADSIWG